MFVCLLVGCVLFEEIKRRAIKTKLATISPYAAAATTTTPTTITMTEATESSFKPKKHFFFVDTLSPSKISTKSSRRMKQHSSNKNYNNEFF